MENKRDIRLVLDRLRDGDWRTRCPMNPDPLTRTTRVIDTDDSRTSIFSVLSCRIFPKRSKFGTASRSRTWWHCPLAQRTLHPLPQIYLHPHPHLLEASCSKNSPLLRVLLTILPKNEKQTRCTEQRRQPSRRVGRLHRSRRLTPRGPIPFTTGTTPTWTMTTTTHLYPLTV